jgi:hypothetical protein
VEYGVDGACRTDGSGGRGVATKETHVKLSLASTPGDLVFNASFSYGATATSADWFRVWVEAEDGTRTLVHQRLAASRYRYAAYTVAHYAHD